MNQTQLVEFDRKILCSRHDNQPIVQLLLDEMLKIDQRLICQLCINELDSISNSINFKKVKVAIQEQQDRLQEYLQEALTLTIAKIMTFKQSIDQLKSTILIKLDELLENIELWVNHLQENEKQKSQYCLIEQIENFHRSVEEKIMMKMNQFQQINYSFYTKIEVIFQKNSIIQDFLVCELALQDILRIEVQYRHNDQNQFRIEQRGNYYTPKIINLCSKHQKEIIFIDIQQNIKKDERTKCIDCEKGDAITVSEFKKLWDSYNSQKQQGLRNCQLQQTTRFSLAKEQLTIFMMHQFKFIQELQKIINKSLLVDSNLPFQYFSIQSEPVFFFEKAEELSQAEKNKKTQTQIDFEKKCQHVYQDLLKKLQVLKESLICKKITYELTYDKVLQQQQCYAIAFNNDGSIMVANCGGQIIIQRMENGQLKEQLSRLEGHTASIYCLVFSKRINWFASGSCDQAIRCWKHIGNNEWKGSQPQKVHTSSVFCILLNKNEDQLISCSHDKSIKIWRVDQQNNTITYQYSLDKHAGSVDCISLNESETILVSCSVDKQIIVWGIGEDKKWEFKYPIVKSTDDQGYRISFINDDIIAWQEYSKGFTHIFKLDNDKFTEQPQLKIELKQVEGDGERLFPSVFNKKYKVLIQKHNKYVYIIRVSNNGTQFNIDQEPIDLNSRNNFGGLTPDGQHLVIWNANMMQMRIYRLKYE